jgi:hypothetical protein
MAKKEPKIVSAVATLSSAAKWGGGASVSAQIEKAMADAVKRCSQEGISMDQPDIIRQRMLEAREGVLERVRQGLAALPDTADADTETPAADRTDHPQPEKE